MTTSNTISRMVILFAAIGSGSMAGYGYYKFVTPSGNIVWEVFGVLLSLWVAVFVGYRVAVSYDLYDDGENRKFKANVNKMRL